MSFQFFYYKKPKIRGDAPTGKFYSRYQNQTYKLRKLGVLKVRKNRVSQKPKRTGKKSGTIEYSERESQTIEFLKVHKKPWDVIESKWKETHKNRMNEIKDKHIELEAVTTKFPLLMNMELGPLLVRQ